LKFQHDFMVMAVENRPARTATSGESYPASIWVQLADGEGEPFTFRCAENVTAPPVFEKIHAEVSVLGKTFKDKRSTSYQFLGWVPASQLKAADPPAAKAA